MNIIFKNNSRSKRITIKLQSEGKIIVTKPNSISNDKALKFVNENKEWIKSKQKEIDNGEKLESNSWILIFGTQYQKFYQFYKNRPIGCFIENNKLIVNPVDPTNMSSEYLNKEIERFLKNTAKHYIIPRTHEIAQIMNQRFFKITLRQQSSRWGSCSSKGNLNFNWRLVHFVPQVIDYVIIHELSHLTHMDHSNKFWNLVRKYDPNFPMHRGILKKFGAQLH